MHVRMGRKMVKRTIIREQRKRKPAASCTTSRLSRPPIRLAVIAAMLCGLVFATLLPGTVEATPLTVTNLNDNGPGSLRALLATAVDGDTITFQVGLTGSILLTSGTLTVAHNVTIQGPGASTIMFRDRRHAHRHLHDGRRWGRDRTDLHRERDGGGKLPGDCHDRGGDRAALLRADEHRRCHHDHTRRG